LKNLVETIIFHHLEIQILEKPVKAKLVLFVTKQHVAIKASTQTLFCLHVAQKKIIHIFFLHDKNVTFFPINKAP
jgi:hypothetical protein